VFCFSDGNPVEFSRLTIQRQKKGMFSMKKLMIAMAAMVMMSGIAQAQDFKPYAGFAIGAFGVEVKDSSVGLNQKNTVVGGYGKFGVDFSDYIAGEIRVGATGKGSKTYPAGTFGIPATFDVKLKSSYFISYLAKLKFPVSQDARVYALIGGTTAKAQMDVSIVGLNFTQNKTKTGFTYGLGGEYNLNDQLSVGGEWVQYWTNVKLDNTTKAKLWGAVATLAYHF